MFFSLSLAWRGRDDKTGTEVLSLDSLIAGPSPLYSRQGGFSQIHYLQYNILVIFYFTTKTYQNALPKANQIRNNLAKKIPVLVFSKLSDTFLASSSGSHPRLDFSHSSLLQCEGCLGKD